MNPASPLDILKKYWGYDAFRPLQAEIVDSVLSGRDTLGLMPTGGGKSITFQVPGLMSDGLTVVITPLISLMKDQVDNLRRRRIRAVFLHSGMTLRERTVAMEHLVNGRAKFLYVAPERLSSDRFLFELRNLQVCLIVVDEAHCISQWGYDFRPSYLRISRLRDIAPKAPVLALTATATPEVAADICRNLRMTDPAMLRMSFTRKNISYLVRPSETKIQEIMHILSRTTGSAIVYVRSRKRTGEIADFLNTGGISAAAYHAGLDYELKSRRQNDWQSGALRVMVATNAFGMGIDKPDVRVVIHFDMPPSLEEYYQEAGRAGRDGLPSYAVLLTAANDQALMRRRVAEAFPDRAVIRKIYERACNFLEIPLDEGYETVHEFDIDAFCRTFKYQKRQVAAALHLLGQAGYLEYIEDSDRRAKAMITVTREELYHPLGLSATAEKVLNRMLRLYTGLFMDYQPISEANLAYELQITDREVYEALLEMSRAKILSYIPRSRVPVVYLPTSREEPRYVQIGKDVYESRQARLRQRTEAMIDYAFSGRDCRENKMLLYFGEKAAAPCGRCDVCRSRRKAPEPDPARLIREIMDFLAARPRGTDYRILEHNFSKIPVTTLTRTLAFLVSEGHIELREGVYYPLSGKGAPKELE